MDLFLLKKLISALIMPLSVILLLLILSILFYRQRPKLSFNALVCATMILFFASLGPVADWLMEPIESQYPTFNQSTQAVDYIIVLGCGHTSDQRLPPSSQLKICSLQRLVEALRIYQLYPKATIITSGFAGHDNTSNAMKVKAAAISLGIAPNHIITENFPKDTEEEAELIAPRIKGSTAVLVTNADHMPRAMEYFHQQGVYPIAAPTGYWVKDSEQDKQWGYYVPTPHKLEQTTTAWYESLGQLVQWLKN